MITRVILLGIVAHLQNSCYICSGKEIFDMNYTKRTIRIKNPSPRLLSLMDRLKDNKREQLERLHNMKLEEFGYRVSL